MSFSTQELLTISEEISREFAPRTAENRLNLVLLPVDARRLHAYWQLADNRTDNAAKPVADRELTLRIFSEPDSPLETADAKEEPGWFDIAIDSTQSKQEVALPPGLAPARTYTAAIGVIQGSQGFTALTYSNSADIPNPRPSDDRFGLFSAHSQFMLPRMDESSPAGKPLS